MPRWKFRAESSETVYCCRWGANSHTSLRTSIALLISISGMKAGSPPQPINTYWELQPWENLFFHARAQPKQPSVSCSGMPLCPSATLQHYCKGKPQSCSQESCSTFWRLIWECKLRPFKERRKVKDSQRGRTGQQNPRGCGYLSWQMWLCREAKGICTAGLTSSEQSWWFQ